MPANEPSSNTSASSELGWLADLSGLNTHSVIEVSGADSLAFLQGQLSCDLRQLSDQQTLIGAHCTPKGRMISSFVISQDHDGETLLLRVRQDMASVALTALKKYAVFSKVTLAQSDWQVLALDVATLEKLGEAAPPANGFTHPNADTVCIESAGRLELWSRPTQADVYRHRCAELNISLWKASQVEAHWIALGLAEVRQATSEEFLPQMFNFDAIRGISYRKGCYTGQEIIARTHHKGQTKKRLYRVVCQREPASQDGHAMLTVGSALFGDEHRAKTVAVVVALADTLTGEHDVDLLAVANDSVVGSEALWSPAGALSTKWIPLPYDAL